MAKAHTPSDKINTTAHLIETTSHHLAHTKRHEVQLKKAEGKSRDFNHEHMTTHLDGAIEHNQKLINHINANYPKEARELRDLEGTVARTTVESAVVRAGNLMARNK